MSENNAISFEAIAALKKRPGGASHHVRSRLEDELDASTRDSAGFFTKDAMALVTELEGTGRFRRDGGLGRLYHPGKISLREKKKNDALHIVIDDNYVSAHIDRHSPLSFSGGRFNYSLRAVVIHNLSGMADHLRQLLRGRWGEDRFKLERETLKLDEQMLKKFLHGPRGDVITGVGPGTGQPPLPDGNATTTVPFSVIDEAVHLLDSQAAPCSIQMEVRIAGRFDEARLSRALAGALRRHPMALVRKAGSRRTQRRDLWELRKDLDLNPLKVIDCKSDAALDQARNELQSLAVPLSESPPLRAWIARHDEGDLLMLNVNHAATDALGALRILDSIARQYTGEPDPLPGIDFSAARDLPERLAAANLPTKVRRYLALAEKLRDLIRPSARLAPEQASDEPGYRFHLEKLSVQETREIKVNDGTFSDSLVAALHLAIAEWNERHGANCGRIGVLVPANTRPARWRHEIVGNFTLPARISTSRTDRTSASAVLRSVSDQSKHKNKTGMGTALMEILKASHLLPLWAKQASVALLPITGNRLLDTAVLSDLGPLENPPSFGPDAGETLELWFSLPARMPLGLSIGASTVGGRLHLSFRCRHRMFGGEAAARFAGCYLEKLKEVAAAA